MKRVSNFYLGLVALVMGFGLMLQSCGGASADKVAAEFNQGCPKVISDGYILENVAAEGNTIAFYYDYRGVNMQKEQLEYAASMSSASDVLSDIIAEGKLNLFTDNDLSYKLVIKCTDGTFSHYIPCDEIKACCNSGSDESNSADVDSYYMHQGEDLEDYVDRLQSMLPVTDDSGFVVTGVSLDRAGLFLKYKAPKDDMEKVLNGDPSSFKVMFKSLFQYSYGALYETLKRENVNVLIMMGSHPIDYCASVEFK